MSKEDRRAGTCNFSPGPMTCLSCPFPECTNNRPPVRGEDGVEKYVNLTDGAKENAMKTKYSVGDIVKVGAKIEKIEIDEKGVKYMLSSGFWKGFKEVREGDLSSGSSRPASKTSEKAKKSSKNDPKASKNDSKSSKTRARATEDAAKPEKTLSKTSDRQQADKRQQERKRPGRPRRKAVGETTSETTTAGLSALGKELAQELASLAK